MVIDFKVGDRVRIKPGSEYYGQANGFGIIQKISPFESHVFQVRWKDQAYSNVYRSYDLEPEITDWDK